jgi:hypothetical protein
MRPGEPGSGRSKLGSERLAGQVGLWGYFSDRRGWADKNRVKPQKMGGHTCGLSPQAPAVIHRYFAIFSKTRPLHHSKTELKRKALRCVMDITAHTYDKTLIFTACSDAPHKRSFREIEVQRT